ncbi:TPR Domain containing protein [Tritrichomonas foetus]|uniref:Intraflagellar transport protein 56 n=1 Tax=Tritrichomonas foetus TaxID=1144522 RepID=A0A1J4JNP4_9EUKA|nr:TPR Domain containing protein [Tritrichomonas foetus]|eukprot:OHT00759.1 TPR Domain containing protein [Tritrichomonas foetus]
MIVGGVKRKSSTQQVNKAENADNQQETPEEYVLRCIDSRDYSGASTFIEFVRDELKQPYTKELALWHGYSLFHIGQYSDAIDVYEKLLKEEPDDTILYLYIASCHFYNQDYEEARSNALRGPQCDFKTRLIFHIAHQTNDEQELFQAHSQLVGTLENQLSLAAIHYMRSHYQDAIEIYQRLLLEHPDFLALNVYIAMCQFKLEQYQESNEAVDLYLSVNSDSAIALNLKSCDYLRMFDPEIAESQLLQIKKFSSAAYEFVDTLITHNLCVFHNGDDGFTILPKLVPILSEARFNLSVMYMRENDAQEAFNLLQDYIPIELNESILKATVNLAIGQLNSEAAPIEEANSTFQEVGQMDVIKDTIQGREALASTKFIVGEYDETIRVLQTIEQFVGDMDEYNYDKGMALAALSRWAEAERYFLMVSNEKYIREIYYNSWLCRCYIKNGKAEAAWNLYNEATSPEDSKTLLNIIAADCFQTGQYYYAMRAYDVLSKYEVDPTFREGLIASAVGVFRGILTKKETSDKLSEVMSILGGEPEASDVLQTIQTYAMEAGDYADYGYE